MNISKLSTAGKRIQSIDLLRAMTMFLMIFVNDLWTLTGVPEWLKHTPADYDGMGFSDVIFPLFLFIVGLSIPLAIKVRIRKNQSHPIIIGHILTRTLALLVMGVYMVNAESINQEAMQLNKSFWQILMASAIFLIWLDYKRIPNIQKKLIWALKAIGIGILIYLAIVYRDGSDSEILWMKTRWWGILGLIGWAYLLISMIYLFLRKKLIYLILAFMLLLFMNVQENSFFEFLPAFKIVVSASHYTLVMAGTLCTAYYLRLKDGPGGINKLLTHLFLFGAIMIAFGFIIRPYFPLSKILATPSWTSICIGIGLISYVVFYMVIDKLGFVKWGNPIKPAGTSTLTCYLMPYFIYPIIVLVGFQWPEGISDGAIGIIKSLLFSLIIIMLVGLMEKKKIVLKI